MPSYSPPIYSGGLITASSGNNGGLVVGNNTVGDFWTQYASTSTGSIAPWTGVGYLGVALPGDCTECDYCLCPQCEACLPNTSPKYVTAALTGWVSDLADVQIIGDPNQTWDLGLLNSYAGYAGGGPVPLGQLPPQGLANELGNPLGICAFSRYWNCEKPFYVRFNPGIDSSSGTAISGVDPGLNEWVNLFTTGNDGTQLELRVTYGGYYVDQYFPGATTIDQIVEPPGVTLPVFVPAPVVSIAWFIHFGTIPVILGQGVKTLFTAGSAGAVNCTRCTTPGCTDTLPGLGALTVTRLDCSKTHTLNTSLVGLIQTADIAYDPPLDPLAGPEGVAATSLNEEWFQYGGVFTVGASDVTGNQSFPATWFPVLTSCGSAAYSGGPSFSVSQLHSQSFSNSYGSTVYSSGGVEIIPTGGGGGGGPPGPGPGPGGGSSASSASSGCLCQPECHGSLATLSCVDGTTAGPLVPCYGSGLAGKVFKWDSAHGGDDNCYSVTSTKSASAATYAPTETWTTCTDCANADLYIKLTPCSTGSGDYWVYVPLWIAMDMSVFFDGTDCYQVLAGNTRSKTPTGRIIVELFYDDCSQAPCPADPAPCTCPDGLATSYTVTFTPYPPHAGDMPLSRTMTHTTGCSWVDSSSGASLILNMTAPCKWVLQIDGTHSQTFKTTGSTPAGSYPDDGRATGITVM